MEYFTSFSLNLLFYFFLLYFCILVFSPIYRFYITIRGIFYMLIIFLGLYLCALLFSIDIFFLKGASITWSYSLVNHAWLFPDISLTFYIDVLSFFFILLVVIIGFFSNIYVLNYLKYEAYEDTFVLMLNWFIFSMLLFVSSNNFFTLFLGWELIGLTSFFLINFWSERRGTLKSSIKAFIFNKVSDFFLLIFIVIFWLIAGKSTISNINLDISTFLKEDSFAVYILSVSLILCSAIKSAQLIGHLWLPDSMEAPVPASALIHSATLVSAGVYLLLRFKLLIDLSKLSPVILLLGSLTAAYGGLVAAAQTDVKKLLAYSTISHCGFLFVCIGLQNTYLTIIYLYLHGLFKAMTFFCVGSFIRVAESQDTRQMGGFSRLLPVDTIFMIICAGNLGGLPFTFGYLYKQFFLINLVYSKFNMLVLGLCFIGMLTSLVYVYRLVYYSAFDIHKNFPNLKLKQLQDNNVLDKNCWSSSTIVQSIIIFLMLTLTVYIYIYLYSYANIHSLVLEQFPLVAESNLTNIKDVGVLYSFYINFFYALYVLVILILLVFECRKTYSWAYKFHFFFYLILFTFSLVFLFTF